MTQAIQTTYHAPTNTLGGRIIVKASAGRMTVGWDHALNFEANHKAAAEAFRAKMGWDGELVGGGLPDGSFVWVFVS